MAEHPLAVQLHSCQSIECIIIVLLGEVQAFGEYRGSDRVIKSIKNTVSILSRLFPTVSPDEAVDLVRKEALMACSSVIVVYSHSPGQLGLHAHFKPEDL